MDSENEQTPLVQKKNPTPLPWRPIIILLMMSSVMPLAFELIFPFINQMLVELRVVSDPENVGFYSGVIESVFSCMSFITVLPCSYASDRIGRKPVILLGMAGLAISMLLFGLSRTFIALILSRCLGGALGGCWAAIKSMAGELTDKSNQNTVFTGIMITYRLGQIIGLPIGGLLAHPERNRFFGFLFEGPFWRAYPFILPCLVGSAFALLSVVMGALFLEETLPSKKKRDSRIEQLVQVPVDTDPSIVPVSDIIESRAEKEDRPSLSSVLTKDITALIMSNFIMCLSGEVVFSVYPIFAFTPVPSGGQGFSEAQIGSYLAVRAIMSVAVMFLFSPIQKLTGRTSPVRLYQICLLLWPITTIFYPIMNWMARGEEGPAGWKFNAVVFVFFVTWSFAGFCWTCMGIMSNDAVPSAAALATINGVMQLSMVFPQAIAPAFATSLFAFSMKSGIAGGNLVWIVMFLLTSAGAVHSLTLREPTFDWRENGDLKPKRDLSRPASPHSSVSPLSDEERQ